MLHTLVMCLLACICAQVFRHQGIMMESQFFCLSFFIIMQKIIIIIKLNLVIKIDWAHRNETASHWIQLIFLQLIYMHSNFTSLFCMQLVFHFHSIPTDVALNSLKTQAPNAKLSLNARQCFSSFACVTSWLSIYSWHFFYLIKHFFSQWGFIRLNTMKLSENLQVNNSIIYLNNIQIRFSRAWQSIHHQHVWYKLKCKNFRIFFFFNFIAYDTGRRIKAIINSIWNFLNVPQF